MNEYIITEKQLKTAMEACLKREIPLPFTEVYVSGDKLPEIVRCRDCECSIESPAWHGAMECWYIGRGVEPDGFCAWGERRDA